MPDIIENDDKHVEYEIIEEEPKLSQLEEEEEEEEEEEKIVATKFKFDGVTYLKAKNTIYDLNSKKEIGEWNETAQKIEFCEQEEEEDEYDD